MLNSQIISTSRLFIFIFFRVKLVFRDILSTHLHISYKFYLILIYICRKRPFFPEILVWWFIIHYCARSQWSKQTKWWFCTGCTASELKHLDLRVWPGDRSVGSCIGCKHEISHINKELFVIYRGCWTIF